MSESPVNDATCLEYRRRIHAAMNYISQHATENLTLEEIAQTAYFSKYHFHRLFKAFAGETVADFTRRIRLEQAANLLYLDNKQSVTNIALEYGFSSAQNFAKQFTKHFGQSPSFFRQARNHDASLALMEQAKKVTEEATTQPRIELDVQIKSQPALKLAYTRFIEPYDSSKTQTYLRQLLTLCGDVEQEFTPIGVAWDNPDVTDESRCRYDIGFQLANEATLPNKLSLQTFPASKCAVYRCEITDNDLEQPWDDLIVHWLPQSGYVLSGAPGLERFLQFNLEDSAATWVIEIWLPIKPMAT